MRELIIAIALFAGSLAWAEEPALILNDLEYFEIRGLDVMVFHDFYPEGHQGGITIIQNGERTAANGDVRLEPAPGQWQPMPQVGKRTVDRKNNQVYVTLSYPDSARDKKGFNPIDYPDLHFSYTVRVTGEGASIRVAVDLEQPLPAEWVGRVGFNLELFPGLLFGKTYALDDQFGIFPPQANGPMFTDPQGEIQIAPLASGQTLTVAPESDALRLSIKSLGNPLQLIDGRSSHNNGWFIVRSLLKGDQTANAVEWVVTPSVLPNWRYQPVVHVSQVGYHPAQTKTAVIELDKNDSRILPAVLKRVEKNGQMTEVLTATPIVWGNFLRYKYLQFDFTRVKKPGMYFIRYGDSQTQPFQISAKVYQRHVWQPTLEYFLPVQMCHVKVVEGYRTWHGLCHSDDALMAPINHNHFDGYLQGPSTLTKYQPLEPVPGLNVGGWHDAGDYDLRVESQAGEIYILSLAYEAFNVNYDATTVDQKNCLVEIHQPDGVPDILQQIEHGALTIIGGYENLGRLYRGIICPTLRQYVLLGDGSTMTDNRVYDSTLAADQASGERSGKADDRWVFTEENPRRELQVAAALAASSRALKSYNDELSAKCLNTAIAILQTNEKQSNAAKINVWAELFLTTGDKNYRELLLSERETLIQRPERYARLLGRLLPALNDKKLTSEITPALTALKQNIDKQEKETPFGVPYRPQIWGAGWNIQEFGVTQYFLHVGFPEIFPKEYMLNALNFVLGNHPGSNTASFASGVGANSLTVAYGVNRADWSYIPGGVGSGTALIRPDFPELKVWPFFWQQTEYVMGGGASNFMFLVRAAEKVLNE